MDEAIALRIKEEPEDEFMRDIYETEAQNNALHTCFTKDEILEGQQSYVLHIKEEQCDNQPVVENNSEPMRQFDDTCPSPPIKSEKKKYERKNHYVCKVCQKLCASVTAHENHMRVHTGEKPFECNVCLKTYRQKIQLKEHIKATHSDKKPYTCNICGMEFSYSQAYKRHLLWHKGRQLNCTECKYKAFRKSQLTRHYQSIHIDNKPYCDLCNRSFKTISQFEVHKNIKHRVEIECKEEADVVAEDDNEQICIYCNFSCVVKKEFIEHGKTHPAFDLYRCQLCDKEFKWKQSFKEHIEKHGSEMINCEHCDFSTPSRIALRIHLKKHASVKSFKCPYCATIFQDNAAYREHKQVKHKLREKGELKFNKCEACLRKFVSKRLYEVHLKNSTCIVFECISCDYRSSEKASWLEHCINSKHDDAFLCEYCTKTFKQESEYVAHIEVHPTHLYECTFCVQKYKCVETFIKHLKMMHADVSLLRCTICTFTCYNPSFFNKHAFRHSLRNRFVCEVCCYRFRDHQHLRKHVENMHSSHAISIHDCTICARKFSSPENLQKHMYVHNQLAQASCECRVCKVECDNEFELKKHMKVVHTRIESVCHLCDKVYAGKSCRKSLKRHMETVHFDYTSQVQSACEHCDNIYYGDSSKDSLRRHMSRAHKQIFDLGYGKSASPTKTKS